MFNMIDKEAWDRYVLLLALRFWQVGFGRFLQLGPYGQA
jgi:hypothetical protein